MNNEIVCKHCGWTKLGHERSSSSTPVPGRSRTLSQCKEGFGFTPDDPTKKKQDGDMTKE